MNYLKNRHSDSEGISETSKFGLKEAEVMHVHAQRAIELEEVQLHNSFLRHFADVRVSFT